MFNISIFDSYTKIDIIMVIIFLLGLLLTIAIMCIICEASDHANSFNNTIFPHDTRDKPMIDDNTGGYSLEVPLKQEPCKHIKNKEMCINQGHNWLKHSDNNGMCMCGPSYYSDDIITREKHDNKYFAIGIPSLKDINYKIIDVVKTDHLSFRSVGNVYDTDLTCTWHCDKFADCTGVLYNKNKCTLLTDKVHVKEDKYIVYDGDKDSTLYLKASLTTDREELKSNIVFDNVVYLYSGELPKRYWLREKADTLSHSIQRVTKDKQYKLFFIPSDIINNSELIGLYTNTQFDIKNITSLNDYYIHLPGTILDIPLEWDKDNLYVYYVEKLYLTYNESE